MAARTQAKPKTNAGTVGQIVGVVGDAKYQNLRSELQPTVYMPLSSRTFGIVAFEIRTAQSPGTMVPLLRGAIQGVSRNLTLYKVSTQREAIENSLYQERLVAWLSSLFAGLALLLAGIGLYGMLAYEVTRRTQEIGICMALGARTGDILRLVIAQGVVLTAAGAVAGIAAAVGLTRYLESLLYGVRTTDAATYIGAAIVLVLASLAACYFPARRAMRVDPMIALRYE